MKIFIQKVVNYSVLYDTAKKPSYNRDLIKFTITVLSS